MMTDSQNRDPFPVVAIPPDPAATTEAVVEYLLRQLAHTGVVESTAVTGLARRVLQRERLGSTAIGRGLAIPHCRTDEVPSIAGVIGELEGGVDWPGAADGRPVYRICLVVMPKGPLTEFLRGMEQLVRQLRNEST